MVVMDDCGKCGKEVKEKDCGVQCDCCIKWFHIKCEGVGKELYQILKEGDNGVKWYCGNCKSLVDNLMVEVRKLKEEMELGKKEMQNKLDIMGAVVERVRKESCVKDDLEEIRKEMLELRGDMTSKKEFIELRKGVEKMKKDVVVKGEMDEVKKEVIGLKKDKTGVDLGTEVRKTFVKIMAEEKQKEEDEGKSKAKERDMEMKMKEVLEREKRRLNVVVMGLPEESEEEDRAKIGTIVNSLIEEVQIKFLVLGRIGKKGEKPRPLRVKFENLEDKRRVLGRARNLKKTEGLDKVYVVPDLTKMQQDEDKKLRSEVKRLRENGETNVKISKGAVIVGARVSNMN